MAAAIATVSSLTHVDIGQFLVAGQCTVAFDTGDYAAGGVAIPTSMEVSLGIADLLMAEPAFDDATNTLVMTVDESAAKFVLWDINAGIEKANGALPSGASFTLRFIGRRRT